jgi:hypothetical protein
MKTYGVIYEDKKELISIVLDDEGNPRLDTLKPHDAGDGWEPPTIIPLVKLPEPEYNSDTEFIEPDIVWFEDRVERQWRVLFLPQSVINAHQREAIKAQMQAEWESLPAWIRGPFADKRNAAVEMLKIGDDEAAIAIIQYAEPPHGYTAEQLAIFEGVRNTLISEMSALPKVI